MSIQQALIKVRAAPMVVSASPNPAEGVGLAGSGVPGAADTTISVSGGVGGFTYSGSFISGGTGLSLLNPNTANPGWQTLDDAVQTRTGTWRTVVTDSGDGYATASVDVPVSIVVE